MTEEEEMGGGSIATSICWHLGPDVDKIDSVRLGSLGACPLTRTTTWILDSPASERFLLGSSLDAEEADREAGWVDPLTVSLLAAPADETGGATLGALERGCVGRVRVDDEGWRRRPDMIVNRAMSAKKRC